MTPRGESTTAGTLPLLRGTLDVLVLQALAGTPRHGFAITTWLEERSDAAGAPLAVEAPAVYQALYRLEARKLVAAEWGISEKQRRARYYRLTPRGRAQLVADAASWRHYARAVAAILDAAPAVPTAPAGA